jgi:hypothetical protein
MRVSDSDGFSRMITIRPDDMPANGLVHELSFEEGVDLLDQQARRYLNMTGAEFLTAWQAGQFDDDPDRTEVMRVAMLIPFADRSRRNGR